MEVILGPLVVAGVVYLVIRNFRRRRSMTPDQRMAEDARQETRRLRRELENHRRYGD